MEIDNITVQEADDRFFWDGDKWVSYYTQEDVDILLAEQHRNTRHDAIDLVAEAFNDAKESIDGPGYLSAARILRDLINLEQRKP